MMKTALQQLIEWGDKMMSEHPQKLLSFAEAIDKAQELLELERHQHGQTWDSIQSMHKSKIASLRESVSVYETLTTDQEFKIRGLEKDLAKRKKGNHWWKAIAIGAIGGIVVNHMSWRGWR